jgi:hypothetical protein
MAIGSSRGIGGLGVLSESRLMDLVAIIEKKGTGKQAGRGYRRGLRWSNLISALLVARSQLLTEMMVGD